MNDVEESQEKDRQEIDNEDKSLDEKSRKLKFGRVSCMDRNPWHMS